MVNINLLPPFLFFPFKWVGGFALSAILILALHFHLQNLIYEKKQAVILLQQEIDAIHHELEYKKPTIHLRPPKNTFNCVKLINLLKVLTDMQITGLYLTTISKTKEKLTLEGYAENSLILSTWLMQLEKTPFKPALKEMQHHSKNPYFPVKFSLWLSNI